MTEQKITKIILLRIDEDHLRPIAYLFTTGIQEVIVETRVGFQ